jgi:3-dehydroquinate synthase
MSTHSLIATNQVAQAIDAAVERMAPASLFVIVDVNTARCVLPQLQSASKAVANARIIELQGGEMHKSIEAVMQVWLQLSREGATRHSLVINVGGGVITDMGAFAAATFKRGIRFINVPTTLLGAVDASVGGKTGFNFNELKNEIGVFREADLVVISTAFFRTLTAEQLLSGYAEMIKHGFLSSREMLNGLLAYDVTHYDADTLLDMLRESVEVKRRFVEGDVEDHGLRNALNFGHTAGHAFEALALHRNAPLPHGYAVALGMVVALVLSRMKFNFPSAELHSYANYVAENYGTGETFAVSCDDYPALLQLMHHDKKNRVAGEMRCALLHDVGDVEVGVAVTDEEMTAALDICRDLLHLP